VAPSLAAAKAPPARLKTAAPLEAVAAAPAPARPAPRAGNTVQTSNTVRPTDTVTASAPAFNFDSAPAGASTTTLKRPSKKPPASNTGLFIALGVGGGVLALGLVVALIMGMGGGGNDPPKKNIAENPSKATTANAKGTNPKKKKATDDSGGSLLDRPEPKERPKPEPIVGAKPLQAKSLEEIKMGVVKILSPGVQGTSQGTGFLINEKGWIATNCHVIDDATDQTKVIINKQPYKVAGLVIKAPEHDMAIIALAEKPFQMTVLDISFSQHPKFGSEVWAIGFPSDTFNLTKGIVSNVCTMNELDNAQQRAFLRASHADPTHLWIQHNAKISPGNSGGPLLNDSNQVIGINTWVSTDIDTGYAGHINHLRDLIAKAPANPTPFPKGLSMEVAENDELQNTVATADRVNQLMQYCGKFSWKPSTKEEFDGMAELARLITILQMAPQGIRDPKFVEFKKAVETACQTLKGMSWDADHVQKINKFAQEATGQALHGVFFFATVTEPGIKLDEKLKADRLTLEGIAQTVLCSTKDGKTLGSKDTRMLVIGMNRGILQGEGMEPQRVILPGHWIELKK
jgi:S1-C subfamily serine protease